MFGRKETVEEEIVPYIPVLTVHMVPQKYEVMDLVSADSDGHPTWDDSKVIDELRKSGSRLGADAVIGLTFRTEMKIVYAYGTAIKYVE